MIAGDDQCLHLPEERNLRSRCLASKNESGSECTNSTLSEAISPARKSTTGCSRGGSQQRSGRRHGHELISAIAWREGSGTSRQKPEGRSIVANETRRIDYYYVSVPDKPGEGSRVFDGVTPGWDKSTWRVGLPTRRAEVPVGSHPRRHRGVHEGSQIGKS